MKNATREKNTVWKFKDFSATQILRENAFDVFITTKTVTRTE